jgi:hypothetical protein
MSTPRTPVHRFVGGARVARAWIRFYTRGLPLELRDARRAEIDADIWEHQSHARLRGEADAITSLTILFRALRGAPDDLGWRREAAAADHASPNGIPAMALSYRTTGWMALAGMIGAGVASAFGLLNSVPGVEVHQWFPAHGSIENFSNALGILAFLSLYFLQQNRLDAVGRFGFGLLLAGTALSVWANLWRPPTVEAQIFVVVVWVRLAMVVLGVILFGLGTIRARVLPEPFRRIPLALGALALVHVTIVLLIDGVAMDASSLIPVTLQVLSIVSTLGTAAVGYAVWSATRSRSGQAAPAGAAPA